MTEAYPHWHEATRNIASPPREDYNLSQLTPTTLAALLRFHWESCGIHFYYPTE